MKKGRKMLKSLEERNETKAVESRNRKIQELKKWKKRKMVE